ncbi:MAG: NUDIX hydrolase [Ekhidna sp.]|nr:NUDIX hydrolase [Ekhidna sp.]
MSDTKIEKTAPFSGKVRVRACGILVKDRKILLLRHHSIGPRRYLWSPPGGGVLFGQSLHETLRREFLEETNLTIDVGEYLFTNEYIDNQYHAIELFFTVKYCSGKLKLGIDPELSSSDQILTEARFLSCQEIEKIPKDALHSIFSSTSDWKEILNIQGLITFNAY